MQATDQSERAGSVSEGAKALVIVADNRLIVAGIHAGLRQGGQFKLLGHVDGRTVAVSTIIDAKPDVVIIDDMQHSDRAASLIAEVKANAPHITVILLTVRMDHDWLREMFDAGASGAISKSVAPAALAILLCETVNGNVVHLFGGARRGKVVAPKDCPLTPRELEILKLVACGMTNGEIARQLWVTEQTVKFHLSKIYRKVGVSNRTGASHYAHLNGLLESMRPPAMA